MMYKKPALLKIANLAGLITLITFLSCNRSLQMGPAPGTSLHLSASTVSFDTVLTSVVSTFRTLTLFNDQENAILISSLSLKGDLSGRSVFVFSAGGNPGPRVSNIRLNGKDSLRLYIKVLIAQDQHTTPFRVQDSLLIKTGNSLFSIPLSTYAQNVHKIEDTLMSVNTAWNSPVPYLINRSLTIGKGITLTLAAGTRIYFHGNTGLTVKGTLLVNGTRQAPVYFISDRRETLYSGVPGQWKGIQISPGSSGNRFENSIIRNAETGISLNSSIVPDSFQVSILNSQISTMVYDGIHSKNSGIRILNSLIYNCGNSLLEFQGDARLQVEQTTFYNSSEFSFHTLPCVSLAFTGTNDPLLFVNNIVSGSLPEELGLSGNPAALIAGNSMQSVILSKTYTLNVFNKDPLFRNTATGDFHLQSAASAAYQAGVHTSLPDSLLLKTDLDGKTRRSQPSAGCYEF